MSNSMVDLVSSDDSDSEMAVDPSSDAQQLTNDGIINQPIWANSEGALMRKARMYQEYMKQIRIPSRHGSIIPYHSWTGLAKSIKHLYGQPLHYLTNILLKQWDKARFESDDEHVPLDSVIHPLKAEATVWLIEEVHRQTASHRHIEKLWVQDSTYHSYIDPIFPKL